jgi:hypothetical protein
LSKVLVIVRMLTVIFLTDVENAFISRTNPCLQASFVVHMFHHFSQIFVLFLFADFVELPMIVLRISLQVRPSALAFKLLIDHWVRLIGLHDVSWRATQHFLVLSWLTLLLAVIYKCLLVLLSFIVFLLAKRHPSSALCSWDDSNSATSWLDFSSWQSISEPLEEVAAGVIHHNAIYLAIGHTCRII